MKLSEMDWRDLKIGDKVISPSGIRGRIFGLIEARNRCTASMDNYGKPCNKIFIEFANEMASSLAHEDHGMFEWIEHDNIRF
jgi:hypothetical protein